MSEASKPTPGPWFHHGASGYQHTRGGFISSTEDRYGSPAICDVRGNDGQPFLANAALIAEAGTVHHETGLTPRQLVEQRDALTKALEDVAASLSWLAYGEVKTFHDRRIMNPAEATGAARAALALVKGAKP